MSNEQKDRKSLEQAIRKEQIEEDKKERLMLLGNKRERDAMETEDINKKLPLETIVRITTRRHYVDGFSESFSNDYSLDPPYDYDDDSYHCNHIGSPFSPDDDDGSYDD